MFVVSAKEFRANQSKALEAAINGQEVRLISKRGHFKITHVTEEDSISPKELAAILQGIEDIKNGNTTRIQDINNIWADIL